MFFDMKTIPALIASLLLGFAAAAQGQYGYSTNADNTLTITNYTGPGGVVTIPANINGLTVTGIGAYAFYRNTNLTSVTIPETVTSLGLSAFEDCNITSVVIPGSLNNIASYAFSGCFSLTNATICNGIPYIAEGMFGGSHLLCNVAIPASVTSIGDDAFYYCGLTNLTVPGNVTNFGDSTFAHCFNLINATFSEGVPYIGDDMFAYCTNLTSVMIPSSLTTIGYFAFEICAFTNLAIPDNVTDIEDGAFSGCSLLTNVTLPNSVTYLGQEAFEGCSSLSNLVIRGSVSGFGDYAFIGCGFTNVIIAGGVSNLAYGMFDECFNLTSVFFGGNSPGFTWDYAGDGPPFNFDTNVTVYYLPGTTGWSNTYQGVPAVLWNPQIQASDGHFGVRSNQFGFNITGTTNIPIVVEACTNLANPVWTPLTNVTLTNGSFYFSDTQWTNYPGRFYGIGFP